MAASFCSRQTSSKLVMILVHIKEIGENKMKVVPYSLSYLEVCEDSASSGENKGRENLPGTHAQTEMT